MGKPHLPSGTVTFLLTDIEGSTRLWESAPAAMEKALDRHNRLLTDVISGHGGVVVTSRGEGDSMFAVFPSAIAAVQASGECQLRLQREPWPDGIVLRVRMGLHTAEAEVVGRDYVDHAAINRCARLKAAAHGAQVLLTQATCDLVASRLGDGFGVTRLGVFRLRDLTEPELVSQLTHPDLPADFPPIRTAAERIGNLPSQLDSFVGRSEELAHIESVLGQGRIVTLTGPGGVGKTRLALQVASGIAEEFRDGAWLCELAAVREGDLVDEAVAAVLSVTPPGGRTVAEGLQDYLRNKDVLLVLDNCEHVLPEAADLAAQLARSCEDLVILATSREGLGIEGEWLVPLPPLPVPREGETLPAIAQAAAVRLFTERAAAVKAGFAVTAGNAEPIASLVRRLDGVALAIELAAARTHAMTPAELLRRLERSFAVLSAGRRHADDRHRTLRATIDWSFDLLSQPEQQLLCRLAVFAGDCPLEAIEEVCGGDGIDPDDVLDLTSSLVARSLIVAEDHGDQTRYRLLETIRQYGEERLGGDVERWRARHAAYYVNFLSRMRDPDRADEGFWAIRLSDEQDNLMAAWGWALSTGNVDVAFGVLAGFAPCEVSSTYPIMLLGESALELPGAVDHEGYPLALAVSAVFASNRADIAQAEDLSRRALEANAHQRNPAWRVEAAVSAARANTATMRSEFLEAASFHERAAAIARDGGDLADTSVELAHAVASYTLADDPVSGAPLAREALAVAREIGAPALIATSLLEVGAVLVTTDPEQARASLRESRELSDRLGYHKARDLVWAAGIAFLLGDRAQTLTLASGAVVGLQRSGNRLLMGITLQLIAGTLAALRPEAAAIIMGAAESRVIESPRIALLVSSAVAGLLGEERLAGLRARGAAMDWDEAVSFALSQATQAGEELGG